MNKHRFYFTDETGGFNGYDRKMLWIDIPSQTLRIAHELDIPLREIMAVEVKPLPRANKTMHLAIHICGPSLGGGKPTALLLIHKNFFSMTNIQKMQSFADELAPHIKGNTPVTDNFSARAPEAVPGKLQAHYALNVSLAIAHYRKLWYSFDTPKTIVTTTLLLMLLGGTVNVFGVLLIAVPFDNYRMSQNLLLAGCSKQNALIAYILLSCPAFIFWLVLLLKWIVLK